MDQEHVDALCREMDDLEALLERDLDQKYEILAHLQALSGHIRESN